MYQADVLLYINNNRPEVSSDTVSQADLTASQSLAETYVAILNSRAVLNEAAHQAGGEYTESELQSMLSASVVNETELLRITVTGADPQDTASLANAVADVSSATMAETVDACNVQIVDRAEVPDSPSSPDILRNTALGLFLGILLSLSLIHIFRGIPVIKTFGQTLFSFRRFRTAIDNYRTWVIAYTKELRLPMMFYTTAINSVFAFLIAAGLFFTRNGVTADFLTDLIFYIIITPVISVTLTKIMYPVSYTHLDVYKRQVHSEKTESSSHHCDITLSLHLTEVTVITAEIICRI